MTFWVVNSAELAPAFIMAEQGYDVWFGNNRGNRYAQAHTSLDVHSEEFWNFNQEQMGLYDATTFIDFVQQKTGQSKITWVGHSQGTTQMFYGASLNPEYFKKNLSLFVALAPVANLYTVEVPIFHKLAHLWREI